MPSVRPVFARCVSPNELSIYARIRAIKIAAIFAHPSVRPRGYEARGEKNARARTIRSIYDRAARSAFFSPISRTARVYALHEVSRVFHSCLFPISISHSVFNIFVFLPRGTSKGFSKLVEVLRVLTGYFRPVLLQLKV